MSHDKIVIRGARQHNLKNINLEIPEKHPDGHNRIVRFGEKFVSL